MSTQVPNLEAPVTLKMSWNNEVSLIRRCVIDVAEKGCKDDIMTFAQLNIFLTRIECKADEET